MMDKVKIIHHPNFIMRAKMNIINADLEPRFCPFIFNHLLNALNIDEFDGTLEFYTSDRDARRSAGSYNPAVNIVYVNMDHYHTLTIKECYPWMLNVFWGVVAHELVHYRQCKQGKLSCKFANNYNTRTMTWNGLPHMEFQGFYYNLQPWEHDANQQGSEVISKLVKQGIIKFDSQYSPDQITFEDWQDRLSRELFLSYGTRTLPRTEEEFQILRQRQRNFTQEPVHEQSTA